MNYNVSIYIELIVMFFIHECIKGCIEYYMYDALIQITPFFKFKFEWIIKIISMFFIILWIYGCVIKLLNCL